MPVLTIGNLKGGVAKTTTTAALAGILIEAGHRVLMIDLDPQSSLSIYFGVYGKDPNKSVMSLFMDPDQITEQKVLQQICNTAFDNLDIIPAVTAMSLVERKATQKKGNGLILKKTVTLCQSYYDYILIDCPPVAGVFLVNAIAASDHIVIPVQTEYLSLKGLEGMVKMLHMVAKTGINQFSFTIVPTLFDSRTKAASQILQTIQQRYARALWQGVIPIDNKLREASQCGYPPSLFNKRSRAVHAYRELCAYIMQQVIFKVSGRADKKAS